MGGLKITLLKKILLIYFLQYYLIRKEFEKVIQIVKWPYHQVSCSCKTELWHFCVLPF